MNLRETLCARVPYLDLLWRGPSIQLHGDLVLRRLLQRLAASNFVTSVVETGTYRGDSTLLFHEIFPLVDVFSIDINPVYHYATRALHLTSERLHFVHGDSKTELPRLLSNGSLAEGALFWLDAHWGNFWPLETEITLITSRLHSCVIMIDDFKVPGREDFGYDLGSGRYDKRPCDMSLIIDRMNKANSYHVLFPKYSASEAFVPGVPNRGQLRGYVTIFQNADLVVDTLMRDDFVRDHYEFRSIT